MCLRYSKSRWLDLRMEKPLMGAEQLIFCVSACTVLPVLHLAADQILSTCWDLGDWSRTVNKWASHCWLAGPPTRIWGKQIVSRECEQHRAWLGGAGRGGSRTDQTWYLNHICFKINTTSLGSWTFWILFLLHCGSGMAYRYKTWVVISNYKISWLHFSCQNSNRGKAFLLLLKHFQIEIFD